MKKQFVNLFLSVLIFAINPLSFTDYILLKDMLPFAQERGWLFGAGKNKGLKIHRIVTSLILSFFDRFLKNQTEIDLMDLNDKNIHIESVRKPLYNKCLKNQF